MGGAGAISGANVVIRNMTGSVVNNLTTDITGYTNVSNIIHSLQWGSSTTNYTYNISVEINGTQYASKIYDPTDNLLNDTFNIQIPDTITLALNGTAANFTAVYGTSLTVNASSTSGTHLLYLNGSSVSNPYAATLAAGYYNFTANSTGNANYTAASLSYFANVTLAASTITLGATTWSPAFGTPANVTCSVDNSQTPLFLYRNDILVNSSNAGGAISDTPTLAAGLYIYTCNSTASQNYTAALQEINTLSVNQSVDAITLALNGVQANFSAVYGTSLSVSAHSTSGTHALYLDGNSIANSYNASLAAGYYNFTANSSGNENYTSASKTFFANITQAPSAISLNAINWTVQSGSQSNVTCTIDNSQTNVSLYRNGLMVNSSVGGTISDIANLATGTYNCTCNSTASQNYSAAASQSSILIIATVSGNASSISTTLPNMSATINGTNATDGSIINATLPVSISSNGLTVLSFSFNFTDSSLNFSQISINSTTVGDRAFFSVSGIPYGAIVGGKNIAIYGANPAYGYVCVKDEENVTSITLDCSKATETPVVCNGASHSGYTCALSGTTLTVTGLNHSGVEQYRPPAAQATGGSGTASLPVSFTSSFDCASGNLNMTATSSGSPLSGIRVSLTERGNAQNRLFATTDPSGIVHFAIAASGSYSTDVVSGRYYGSLPSAAFVLCSPQPSVPALPAPAQQPQNQTLPAQPPANITPAINQTQSNQPVPSKPSGIIENAPPQLPLAPETQPKVAEAVLSAIPFAVVGGGLLIVLAVVAGYIFFIRKKRHL